jgi:hypothetical protein
MHEMNEFSSNIFYEIEYNIISLYLSYNFMKNDTFIDLRDLFIISIP